jgi:hypothetical protein
MILVLSSAADRHAAHVVELLKERGASFVCFDPARFPRDAALSLSCKPFGRPTAVLDLDGASIDLASVRATWFRRPGKPIAHDQLRDPTTRAFVEQEAHMVLQDLWSALDCRWLPGPPSEIRRAEGRFLQLKVAAALGFELPATVVTNRPADVLALHRECNGRIVSKQAGKAFSGAVGDHLIRYTELVSPRDLAHARAIVYCPTTLQAYVPKRVELRITVVGERVFAAEIHSQTTNHTRHDWRRYDHLRTPHHPHPLPRDLAQRCVQLVERLGLRYGAIDMVLTPDGQYVFLEINPNGQYLWIEGATGLPISDAICDLLMAADAVQGSCPAAIGASP